MQFCFFAFSALLRALGVANKDAEIAEKRKGRKLLSIKIKCFLFN